MRTEIKGWRVISRKGGGEDDRTESWREPEAREKVGGHVSCVSVNSSRWKADGPLFT